MKPLSARITIFLVRISIQNFNRLRPVAMSGLTVFKEFCQVTVHVLQCKIEQEKNAAPWMFLVERDNNNVRITEC